MIDCSQLTRRPVSCLQDLEKVLLHTVVVDDLDYSPLLDLPKLRSVRAMKVRGMRPEHDELRRRLPWKA